MGKETLVKLLKEHLQVHIRITGGGWEPHRVEVSTWFGDEYIHSSSYELPTSN